MPLLGEWGTPLELGCLGTALGDGSIRRGGLRQWRTLQSGEASERRHPGAGVFCSEGQ